MIATNRLTADLGRRARDAVLAEYRCVSSRLLLLDYDGTLVPFAPHPAQARPKGAVCGLLARLSSVPGNEVTLISGRDRKTLEDWFGALDLSLVAEHGAWLKRRGRSRWSRMGPLTCGWKRELRPLFQEFLDRVPGSFLEEKEFSLAWHYRSTDPETGTSRARELLRILTDTASRSGLDVLCGNKVVELTNRGVDKGSAALSLLRGRKYGFILAIGDDSTDEAMFRALPERAHSIKVGTGPTRSKFRLAGQPEVVPFLLELACATRTG